MKVKRDTLEKIYLLRNKPSYAGYHNVPSDAEYVFCSRDEAFKFIQKLVEDGNAQRLFLNRIELIEIFIDEEKPWEIGDGEQYWVFNHKGEIIQGYETYTNEISADSFTGKFSVGDIVLFCNGTWDTPYALAEGGGYGVVMQVPFFFEEWVTRGESPSEWDPEYIVYFITRRGLISHLHLLEGQMTKHNGVLPDEFEFLKIYSQYLKGHTNIPNGNVRKILNEHVYTRNTKLVFFRSKDNELYIDYLFEK